MLIPPSSWWLAPVAVGSVLLLQLSAELPSTAWLGAIGVLGALAALVAAVIARRAPGLAGYLLLGAIACVLWTWSGARATLRIADRLPAALEGTDLRIRGTIDTLPVPLRHGHRFEFRVEACVLERLDASGTRERQEGAGQEAALDLQPDPAGESAQTPDSDPAPGSLDCGLPSRIQLGWQSGFRGPGREPVPTLRPGQRWLLTVRLKRPHASNNPGAFDRELRWLQEGVGAVGSVRRGELLAERVDGVMLGVERTRLAIRDAIFDATGSGLAREAGVLAALAIGDQAAIDPELWVVFNQTGVGHLMSISGLHITMLAGLGGAAAGWMWRRRWAGRLGLACFMPAQTVRLSVAVAVAFAYALLAGWGIPAQRTCFMLAAAAVLVGTGRGASIVAAVGAAAAVIVVLDPWAPLSAGFWLSFGAVMAIVWVCAGNRFGRSKAADAMDAALRTQWAATVVMLPLGAWFFGAVSLVGPLANAVAIPLVSAVVTPLALAGGALALASTDAAAWLLGPAALLLRALLAALEALAALPGAALPLPRPGITVLVATLAACVMLLAPAGVPRRALGAIALLPLAVAPLHRPGPGALWLTALDVGQGMAVVLQVADRTLVYDTGPTTGPSSDAGSRVIIPWLKGQGIARPDAVIVSHLDDDHSGGALSLLRAMPPDWFASSLPDTHRIPLAARRALPCRRGERWRWADTEFEWLSPTDPPERTRGSPTNAVSCVLRVRSPAGTVLLPGDIEAPQERRLVEHFGSEGLAADVLLVPHHGSATSSTEAFLDAVSPRWAIFQAAYRSRFRHPHPRVLQRYVRRDIGILRSDADGAVQLRLTPGAPVEVIRSRHDPARYWRVAVAPP
jgi:competence protein ComEC